MKKIINLVVLLFLFSCSHAQERRNSKSLTGNTKEDIIILLPKGQYHVDIIDKIEMDPKAQLLMQKLQAAVQKNPDWFIEQQRKVKTGEPLPYSKQLGLTKEEYEEFVNLPKNPNSLNMTKSSSETVAIKYSECKITFVGSGRLKVLDELSINLNELTAKFGKIELPKPESVNINTADNGLRSKWQGFSWRFEEAN
ncbi:hypothetical protein HUW51_16925 [Adhaeribacter swui]|uniref:Uncharacterized protein n=1 Tax=Adhaeribacter swui TaxID=2086471 RepID=A0A7G7GAY8_9BACT|nr:hypothetical protein [Adhaeribacter swui]QNF34322.1 hypothetical protein HUW51_16925 [Adhaeribacter swui]